MAGEETVHNIAASRCQKLQRRETMFKKFKGKFQLTYKGRNIKITPPSSVILKDKAWNNVLKPPLKVSMTVHPNCCTQNLRTERQIRTFQDNCSNIISIGCYEKIPPKMQLRRERVYFNSQFLAIICHCREIEAVGT